MDYPYTKEVVQECDCKEAIRNRYIPLLSLAVAGEVLIRSDIVCNIRSLYCTTRNAATASRT